MKHLFILSIWLGTIICCRAQQPVKLELNLHAIDLSENMFKNISSGDDELLLIIYTVQPGAKYPVLRFVGDLTADSIRKIFHIPFQLEAEDSAATLAIVLIEKDTRNSTRQTEAVCRLYLDEIEQATTLDALNVYLGDDDLLGIKRVSVAAVMQNQTTGFVMQGLDKTDKYVYEIEIVR